MDLASVDLGAAPHADDKGKVDLILEVEGKEDGWEVMTDIGGMKRVLLNIVGVRFLSFPLLQQLILAFRCRTRSNSQNEDMSG